MKLKKGSIALLTLAGMFYMSVQKADACTRAVYIGPDHMVVTGTYNGLERRYYE